MRNCQLYHHLWYSGTGLLFLPVNTALTFCMGTDVECMLDSPIGQPMTKIFWEKSTLTLWTFVAMHSTYVHNFNFPACVLIVIGFQRLFHRFLAASRQTFAFARDGAFSLLSIFHCINRFTGTPVKMHSLYHIDYCALHRGTHIRLLRIRQ
ncbi:hypothetical protein EDD17DRAFT_934125 [Pisolithus thermaeus]|nr:hypothetical protein EDD17DRAFT_934125 [Pisolithus thermaeus]